MNNKIVLNDGIFPAMITPFDENGDVDYCAASELTRWYAKKGCQGIFSVCLSSEIFDLTLDERIKLATTVVNTAPEGVDVVVSGHISDRVESQIEELREMAKTGAKAVILISNRLAAPDEGDEVFIKNTNKILDSIPDINFGLYEAPYPYKRKLTPELLKYFADSGRFLFVKDTCCCISEMKAKINAIKGTPLKLYNANSASYLDTLALGASGLSGVMGNFHPELYIKLMDLFKAGDMIKAVKLQNFLGFASLVQYQMYPINAKFYLQLEGLPIKTEYSRNRSDDCMDEGMKLEIIQMHRYTEWVCNHLDVYLNS